MNTLCYDAATLCADKCLHYSCTLPDPLHPAPNFPDTRLLVYVQQMGTLWKEMPVSRAITTYPSGFPGREPCLQVPLIELPQRGTPHLQNPFKHISKSKGDEHTQVCPAELILRASSFMKLLALAMELHTSLKVPLLELSHRDAPFPEHP